MNKTKHTSYQIPKNSIFYQEVIKKSRFIVHIGHTPDVKSAKEYIAGVRSKYSDAGHHCWAHVAGEPGGSHMLGFSDDGEPNGTAGKPMLNVLMGSGIGEITAVVTRYFGGIKLGTGGLVRAYGGSLNHAMDELLTTERIPETLIEGTSDYSQQSIIEQELAAFNIINIGKDYKENISWKIILDSREAAQVIAIIFDKTSGRVQFELPDDL